LESREWGALAAPASAASASNPPFLKLADSRRFNKKKFEPTVFAMIDKSWQLFFARAIFLFCYRKKIFTGIFFFPNNRIALRNL
jgi:hypothetical protein